MKSIILFFAIITTVVCSVSAQSSELQKWANKTGKGKSSVSQSSKSSEPVQTSDYRMFMEKSTKYQCGAVAFVGVGAGLSIAGALISTKDPEDYLDLPDEERKDKTNSDRKLRKGLFIGAGASFGIALCLEIIALDYKLKAGKSLKVFSNGTGGGLALTF